MDGLLEEYVRLAILVRLLDMHVFVRRCGRTCPSLGVGRRCSCVLGAERHLALGTAHSVLNVLRQRVLSQKVPAQPSRDSVGLLRHARRPVSIFFIFVEHCKPVLKELRATTLSRDFTQSITESQLHRHLWVLAFSFECEKIKVSCLSASISALPGT